MNHSEIVAFLRGVAETHRELCRRVTDDPSFARSSLDGLLERLLEGAKAA